jgi:hypothetical protein
MNQHVIRRETAVSPALARRETREPNPYDRIIHSGTASGRFQVLRSNGRKFIPTGSHDTLAEAIAARDRMPERITPHSKESETDERN